MIETKERELQDFMADVETDSNLHKVEIRTLKSEITGNRRVITNLQKVKHTHADKVHDEKLKTDKKVN